MSRAEREAVAAIGVAINSLETAARCIKQADADAEIHDAIGVTLRAATLLNRLMRRSAPNGRPCRSVKQAAAIEDAILQKSPGIR